MPKASHCNPKDRALGRQGTKKQELFFVNLFDCTIFAMNVKLSVIIPVYNTPSTLRRCVESVVAQLPADAELLLVDDGSTDCSPSLCDELAMRYPQVTAVHKENGGLSDARNRGLTLTSGQYVSFVDSDDYISGAPYAHAISLLDSDGDIGFVEFPVYVHYGASDAHMLTFADNTLTSMTDYWLHSKAYTHCYAWNKVYRRELFQGVGYAYGKAFEDVILMPQLLSRCKKLALSSVGCYYYCFNERGITATASARELTDLLEAHISVLRDGRLLRGKERSAEAASYYAHVLNIQLDIFHITGKVNSCFPILPYYKTFKLMMLHLLGLQMLCKLHTYVCHNHLLASL